MTKVTAIYRIISPDGKVYVGQTTHVHERIRRHKSLKNERQEKIHNSLKNLGVDNHKFEIIQEFPKDIPQSVLDAYEIFCIEQYELAGIEMLNIQRGGKNGLHAQETKDKIRKANTGVVFTKERLQRMSDSQKGKPSPNKGRAVSEETKQKLREQRIGKPLTAEHRAKIKAGLLKRHSK